MSSFNSFQFKLERTGDHLNKLDQLVRTYLRDNPQLCEEYGRNGREYVEKHFTRKAQAEKLERMLLELVRQQ